MQFCPVVCSCGWGCLRGLLCFIPTVHDADYIRLPACRATPACLGSPACIICAVLFLAWYGRARLTTGVVSCACIGFTGGPCAAAFLMGDTQLSAVAGVLGGRGVVWSHGFWGFAVNKAFWSVLAPHDFLKTILCGMGRTQHACLQSSTAVGRLIYVVSAQVACRTTRTAHHSMSHDHTYLQGIAWYTHCEHVIWTETSSQLDPATKLRRIYTT